MYTLGDRDIERFLQEDCPYGDLTTILLEIGEIQGRMSFETRQDTVVCCTEEAGRLLEKTGCTVTALEASGSMLTAGQTLLQAVGSASSLHAGWKTAVNLLEAASGIATRTHRMIAAARSANPSVEIVATRKVFPGTKAVATKAVYAGGGFPHRLGLSESVLIFPQHAAFLRDQRDLADALREIKSRAREKKIAIEVLDQAAALTAVRGGADILQVDKIPAADLMALVQAVRWVKPDVVVAAAGGITIENAAAYAETGVDILVTSAVYWGAPADIAVHMEPTDGPL